MRKLVLLLSSLLAFGALVAVTQVGDAPAAAQAAAEPAGGITVNGSGSVSAEPDRAQLFLGVETQAETARAAVSQNAAAMRRLLGALRAAGATDLQTQHVSVSARSNDGRSIAGYAASNTVSATVRQVAQAGAVIDAAVAAGANQVSGPMLSSSNAASLYRQALAAAVADARRSAEALAQASGLSLGRITAVVEGGSGPMPLAEARAADGSSTPIEPGRQQVTAFVTVTFAAG
ncbi:MAG TPA: SIMPL domain-containing protein [Gaiellaceae bacterium]|nr:SIMPL domain-containing protein [Gaiellaceae bacterium]